LLAKTEETEIASSIRNAMSHLRAGSLPAALVRPIFENDESDLQVALNSRLHDHIDLTHIFMRVRGRVEGGGGGGRAKMTV
jgi:hypothetical protein